MKKFLFSFLLLFPFSIAFANASYTSDEKAAYTWAFNKWITTKSTIDKANMKWEVSRIELAKMISNYAIKTLKKKKDTSKKCVFTDVTSDLDLQYDNWVTNVCQLWLMWQWITKFRPYDKVTRAEFWTILSRLLYWDKYNWWNPYYKLHVNKLYLVWIMSDINWVAKNNETRGNVMIMLKKSADLWSIINESTVSFSELKDKIPVKCISESAFDIDPFEYTLTKRSYLLPYKNWYFSFDISGQDWVNLYITYKLASDLCRIRLRSESIFWYQTYNKEDSDKLYDLDDDYQPKDSNLVKTLNCDITDNDSCVKELKRYVYNLFVWKEVNQKFSSQLRILKNKVDNNIFDVDQPELCDNCYYMED